MFLLKNMAYTNKYLLILDKHINSISDLIKFSLDLERKRERERELGKIIEIIVVGVLLLSE